MTKLVFNILFLLILFNSSFAQNRDDEKFIVLVSDANIQALVANIDSAKLLYLEALNLKESAAVNYALANIYFNENDNFFALQFAEKALNLAPNNRWYQLLLFDIYKSLNDYNRANTILTDLLNNSDYEADYLLAIDFYFNLSDYQGTLRVLDIYVNNFGLNIQHADYYYYSYYNLSDTTNFFLSATQFLEKFSDDYILNLTIDYFIDFNLYDDAISLISSSNFSCDYYSFILYAEKSEVDNSYNSLISFLNDTNELSPNLSSLLSNYINFILTNYTNNQLDSILKLLIILPEYDYNTSIFIAQAYKRLNFLYDAISFYKIASDLNFTEFSTFTTLMTLYSRLFMWDTLDSLASVSLDYYPAQPYNYLFKAIALLYSNNIDDAYFYLNSALNLTFNDEILLSYINFYLSEYYRLTSDTQQQFEFFNKALTSANNSSDLLFHFIFIYLSNNVEFQKVAELLDLCSVNNSYSFYIRSFYNYRIENYTDALDAINQAIDISKVPNFIYFELCANIYLKLGNNDLANVYFDKSIKFGNKQLNKNL